MPKTLFRQSDTRTSETYSDALAPGVALEAGAVTVEDDLQGLRSQVSNLLNVQTGRWYDDLDAPVALDTGTKRGVNSLNSDLHLLERKRVLVSATVLAAVTVGAGQNFQVLALGELPGNTTAAVGAVATRGAVAAVHSGVFGTHSLAQIGGTNALNPKNLVHAFDANTLVDILSAGRRVFALLQTETGTDGHTMTGTTPFRAQLSFVRTDGAGTALEAVPVADIEGKSVHYASPERKAMEDLNEQDFLSGNVSDVSAGTSSLQEAYTNQGATPVDVVTHSRLDLEGPGLMWEIRDDLEASLFNVTEGSAGGTSAVIVGADVDLFTSNAVHNEFLQGGSFGTTGVPVQVGETVGVVERAADLTLRASGVGHLQLDDAHRAGSTWVAAYLRLSDSSAEWTAFREAYGEVSLLSAMRSALHNAPTRAFHVVTPVSVAADTDLGGPATAANNLDVNFPNGFVTAGIMATHLYLNGRLMRPGADVFAGNDYYPGTSFISGNVEIKFSRITLQGDQLASYVY